ncbi:MAG: large repetitive protein [Frankiaceae bacterium]|jgi:hypothetical protein|nr:large repetitive protein [Frankiaceae bacterium]
MQHALRRTAVIIASSAVVLSGAPLLGTALAASTLTQSSVTPASSPAVQNSHPTISATYTDGGTAANLDPASTITVTKGASDIGCTGVVSTNTITCNYSGVLRAGQYTITIHAIEASNPANTADNTSNFTVDAPVIQTASPAANERKATLPNGVVAVTYNEKIDDKHSTISVKQISDLNGNPAGGTPLTGTTGTNSTGAINPPVNNSDANNATQITFTPDSQPTASGTYEVDLDVFGVTGSAAPFVYNPNAETKDTYTFVIDTTKPAAPTNLSAPTITSSNQSAVPFSGKGRPGDKIVVAVTDGVHSAVSNSATPLTIPTCASTTSCPWTVNLAITNAAMNDTTTGSWTATETNDAGSTASDPVAIIKDTTAPANPTIDPPSLPAGSATLHISGTDNDAQLDHYNVTITDAHGHTIGASPNPITLTRGAGDVTGNGAFAKDIDVSGLDDGALSITVKPVDQYGNVGTGTGASATKNAAMQLVFGSSAFKLANSDVLSFPTVLARPGHAIQQPSQIVIVFNNTITTTRSDNGTLSPKADVHAPAPYFTDNNGNGNKLNGTYTEDASDPSHRTLLVTPPAGLSDGGYTLHVDVFEGNGLCDINSDPKGQPFNGNGDTGYGACPSYSGYVNVPGTQTPFVFTVDTHGPAAPGITTVPSGTIDGSNVGDVFITVSGEPGSTVTLSAKSSGGGALLALNQGQPLTIGNDGKVQDEESGSALALLPDGTLTISAIPTDVAGNVGTTGTGLVSLAARPSIPRSLSVSQSDSSFTLHWVAPSYDGFAPMPNGDATSHLTGYRYTYQDTAPNAVDTDVHSVTVSTPTATSATQAGLLVGHTYAITLCALNGIDGPCNTISTSATPAYFTALTAGVSKALVAYGNTITLSGRLTRTDIGAGIANEPIKVTPNYDNGTTGAVISLTTNSLGNWSVQLKPAKNALYVVTFNATHADANYQPSNSSVRSLVAVALRIDKVTARSTSHAYPVTVTGHITPNQSGRVVNIYAKASGSTRYQRIGTAKITSASTWTFTKLFGKGTFNLYANFPSQNGNVGANSQTVTFTRS